MANSKLLTGSICVSDLLSLLKDKHSAFVKSSTNEKIYCNVKIWLHNEPDNFKNDAAMQLMDAKDAPKTKEYIGNFRFTTAPVAKPVTDKDLQGVEEIEDDLPW